jgi:hypothetical protein
MKCLEEWQQKRNGRFVSIAPGRKMVHLLLNENEYLVGYWSQRGMGSRTISEFLAVRSRLRKTSNLPEFIMSKLKGGKITIYGFEQVGMIESGSIRYALFKSSELGGSGEPLHAHLQTELAKVLEVCRENFDLEEISFQNGSFSVLVKESLSSGERVEAIFSVLVRTIEELATSRSS